MRQSPAYDIIKEEGLKEGLKEGRQKEVQKLIVDIIKIKFEVVPMRIVKTINGITDIDILESLHSIAVKCNSIEELKEKLKLILEG
ncbi:hypothetical protein FJZ33_05795 [Candidatus Poribacteria bacterium]|nr:hypothetical protein [Candidatus Poribacteria bacterium]